MSSRSGNFSYDLVRLPPLPTPYKAKVTYTTAGRTYERVMVAAQTSGDCNSCHTQTGANMAPGRITIPYVP